MNTVMALRRVPFMVVTLFFEAVALLTLFTVVVLMMMSVFVMVVFLVSTVFVMVAFMPLMVVVAFLSVFVMVMAFVAFVTFATVVVVVMGVVGLAAALLVVMGGSRLKVGVSLLADVPCRRQRHQKHHTAQDESCFHCRCCIS